MSALVTRLQVGMDVKSSLQGHVHLPSLISLQHPCPQDNHVHAHPTACWLVGLLDRSQALDLQCSLTLQYPAYISGVVSQVVARADDLAIFDDHTSAQQQPACWLDGLVAGCCAEP